MFSLFRRRQPPPAPPPLPPAPANQDLLVPLLDALIEGVLVLDPDRRVRWANRALAGLLNRPPPETVGRPLWEVLRHRELGKLLDATLQTGRNETRELVFGAGLEERPFRVRATPLRVNGGPGVLLTFHDLGPLRSLENLRKEFVANVSHELKTPLTALRATLDTLVEGALNDPAHARDFLMTAQEQAERLHRLTEGLLTLSLLERPGPPRSPDRCDAKDVARRVVRALDPLAQKDSIELTTDLPEGPLSLPLSADELAQVLMNLLDNALKFSRSKGRVVLRARTERGETILQVEDDGVGIPEADQARIFERFYRVDKARSQERGGTGLGLAIVKHLVENRGGTVSVSSTVGQGSVFTVRWPDGVGPTV